MVEDAPAEAGVVGDEVLDHLGFVAVAADQPGPGRDPVQPSARQGPDEGLARRGAGPVGQPVDDVGGHVPVGGQLPPDDGERTVGVVEHQVGAGQVGGRLRVPCHQGPIPPVSAHHVGRVDRVGEHPFDGPEQERPLLRGDRGLVGHVAVHRVVGETQVDASVGLWEREDEAVQVAGHGGGQRRRRPPQRGRVQDEVHTSAGPQADTTVEGVRPRTGSDDHPSGMHLDVLAVDVEHRPVTVHLDGRDTGQHRRTERRSGPSDGHDQACVVDQLAVGVEPAADEAGPIDGRHPGTHTPRGQPAGAGQGPVAGPRGDAQRVAGHVAEAGQHACA